jgi:uncharacterized protein YndB with AHSA1/START domain
MKKMNDNEAPADRTPVPRPPEVNAPVMAAGEIDISAPINVVWSVLTDVAEWPSWNPEIETATIDGGVTPGSSVRWKAAGPGTIASRIEAVDAPRRIVWTGRTMGIRATHTWRLAEHHGGTLVRMSETLGGPMASILRRPLQKTMNEATRNGPDYLKAESERRAVSREQLAAVRPAE